ERGFAISASNRSVAQDATTEDTPTTARERVKRANRESVLRRTALCEKRLRRAIQQDSRSTTMRTIKDSKIIR
ncbi:hypothetical protein PENTCL1PPCAC_30418, partial [Pristionchus entomophagus]